jgi:hypothetical protein
MVNLGFHHGLLLPCQYFTLTAISLLIYNKSRIFWRILLKPMKRYHPLDRWAACLVQDLFSIPRCLGGFAKKGGLVQLVGVDRQAVN